jgi:outer membrane protein assembly factor BamD
MFMKKIFCLTSLACLILAGCSSIPTPSEKYAKFSAEQIYQTAEVKLAKDSYKDATEAYEALDALYPFNPHAQQAQLDMVYAYYQTGDMPSTAAAAERYIRLYPRAENVDYAYYMKGLANFNQDRGFFQRYFPVDQSVRDPGTMTESYQNFMTLLKLFPQSPYAPDAKQHIIYLRNTFAQRDQEVAQFYYQKEAYEAAINRANEVLVKYSDTPAAKDALTILYNSYQKLGLTNEAAKVKQVIDTNK